MSCHEIGKGMASVGEEILRLFDEQRYDVETARQLLQATIRGVSWCDGNKDEAEVSLVGRCACCLKKVDSPKDDLVFGDQYFAELSGVRMEDEDEDRQVLNLYMEEKILAPQICRACYKKHVK